MTIITPLAGNGSRFFNEGYTQPKPLIPLIDKSMIESVIENLKINGKFIFIIRKEHDVDYKLSETLKRLKPDCVIVFVNELTEGPVCSVLLAEQHIDNNSLIVINCDQMIHDFNINTLMEFVQVNNVDGLVGAFISESNKNSYVKLNELGDVIEIKEKIVISNIATNGLHFWRNGKDFITSAKKMIEKNDRYNGEFYVAPTFNYLIVEGKKIKPYFYNLHFPIGTPEDLNKYKELYGHS